jgi:hypothetical protein
MEKRKQLEDSRKNKYTEGLPEHLRERYEEGLTDPHLLHLKEEIGLMDIRIRMLVENLDRQVLDEEDIEADLLSEFPDLDADLAKGLAHRIRGWMPDQFVDYRTFKRLETLVDMYDRAMLNREIRKADASLRELHHVIREGRKSGEVWHEISDITDQRRRLVDQEQKRLTQAAQLITVEKVVMLLDITIEALRGAVTKYVPDQEIRDYILVEAEEIYGELLGSGEGNSATYQIEVDGQGKQR